MPGQVLASKQMLRYRTTKVEHVFLWKTKKSDILCVSSSGSDG